MQIKSFISYIYFRIIEPDIEKDLTRNKNHIINNNYDISPEKKQPDFGKYNESIERFKEIFKESFTEEQYQRMLYRLSDLTIEEKELDYKLSFTISAGTYDSYYNKITINKFNGLELDISEEELLFHELMHMASTNYSAMGSKTGLELSDLLGVQLNEGYTDYLTRKYFTRGYKYTESHENNIMIAKGIENIIGSERMEELFFTSNINGLIDELSKYISRENVIKLLFLIDRVPDISDKSKEFDYVIKQISLLNEQKLIMDLTEGKITQKEYEEQYAIKVKEYRMYQMWSEDTKVTEDETSFILHDHEYVSSLYERSIIPKNKLQYQKN